MTSSTTAGAPERAIGKRAEESHEKKAIVEYAQHLRVVRR